MSNLHHMPEALVSVCLPVYNGERYLHESIQSVLRQSYTNFELLICDDGSTDSSPEICAQYALEDKRIRFWRNDTNRGLFANYNICMTQARGGLIKPFAQDDLLHPDMLARAVAVFDAHEKVSLVSVGRRWIDHEGVDISRHVRSPRADKFVPANRPIPGSIVIRKALSPVTNFIGEPVSVIFRAAANGSGFDEELAHVGDLEYWIRLLRNGYYYFESEELCVYRSHPDSQTCKNWENFSISTDFLKLGDKFGPVLDEVGLSREHFLAQNVQSAVVGAISLWDRQHLDVTPMSDPFSSDISATPKERALLKILTSLYSLPSALVSDTQDLPAVSRELVLANSIYKLERGVFKTLNSPSWKFTKPLREINRLLGFRPRTSSEFIKRKPMTIEEQISYVRYLRKFRAAIRRSRSWKVSAAIRMFMS